MSELIQEKKDIKQEDPVTQVNSEPRFEQVPPAPIDKPAIAEVPVVMSTIETAASIYAIGYRADTHKDSLKAFCISTGYPSYGPMETMLNSLRAYGYAIKAR
jgi:hypothetical protein